MWEKIKGFVSKYMVLICIVIFAGVALKGWMVYNNYVDSQLSERMAEDKKHQDALKELESQLVALKIDKAKLTLINSDLALESEKWRKKANDNKPPAPVPDPPKDIAVVVEDIEVAGVPFVLTLNKPGDDPMFGNAITGTKYLPTIWNWSKEAARVPGLESSYAIEVGYNGALNKEVFGLKKEIVKSDEIIAKAGVKDAERQKREDNLIVIQNDLKKVVRREKIKGWIRVGAAAVTAYIVGKNVK